MTTTLATRDHPRIVQQHPTQGEHRMSTKTLAQAIKTFGINVHDHLERELGIPIHTGLQRQGDIIVIPSSNDATTPVPASGVPVVRGEAGGNTHAVVADGPVYCDTRQATASNLTLALLTVPAGSIAYLAHPEHGYSGIGPGTYEIRRQREQADELRMVSD